MNFILVNVSLDKAILFFIPMSHLVSGVIVKPKYLKVLTCFILSSLQRMLHTGMSDCFEVTLHSVFFAFRSRPLFSLSIVTVVRIFCSFCSESAIYTVSSAYLRLFMLLPRTLTPSCAFVNYFAVGMEEVRRKKTQLCLIPI